MENTSLFDLMYHIYTKECEEASVIMKEYQKKQTRIYELEKEMISEKAKGLSATTTEIQSDTKKQVNTNKCVALIDYKSKDILIKIEESDAEYYGLLRRKYANRLDHDLLDGQHIWHKIDNDVICGQYDKKADVIKYMNLSFESLDDFALWHYYPNQPNIHNWNHCDLEPMDYNPIKKTQKQNRK